MNEKQKHEMLTKAVSALLAASLVPTVSAAEIANALAPVAIVQEAEVQQTEQELNLAVYAQASLQAQIDKAVAGQVTTLTLQGETSEDLTIPAGKSIVLNLNGHTLTNQSGHTITNYGTLTITGSGTVDNVSHARAAVFNDVGGTVILNGGTYTRSKENGQSKEDSGNNSYYNIVNWGAMTINDGVTVSQNGTFSSMIENGFYDGTGKTNNPKLTINGGTFSGGLNTVKNDDRGVLEIVDGTFTNVKQAAVLNWNETTIKGGQFTANDKADAIILNGHIDDVADQGKLTITGGTFTGTGNTNVIQQMDWSGADAIGTVTISGGTFATETGEIFNLKAGTESNAKIQLSGGTFATSNKASKEKLNDYVTEDSSFDPTTGTVSVKKENAAASVDGQNYRTLQAAIDAASNGATVVLKQSVNESVNIPAEKTVTLDLAGHDITASGTTAIIVRGSLTVKDSTATGAPTVAGSDVTYTSGKVSATQAAIAAVDGGKVVVESGTLESSKNIALSAEGNLTPGGSAVNSKITVKGGYVLAQEFAATAQGRGAELSIEGGVLKAKDNAVIAGNGTKTATVDRGGTIINISGGTMIGTIQSTGYIACGVYHPQEGTLNITGGTFQITKGVGVLVRAGSANITGGEIITTGTVDGKVGDSQIIEGCFGVVYDTVSKYPGAADADKIAVGGKVKIVTDNGNDPVKMRRAADSTENHIEVTGGSFSASVDPEYLKGLNAELKANSGNAPYSYYADAAAAEEAAKKLPDGGTVKTLRSARIGNKDYATLAEAIAAAKANDEILLLTDVQTSAYTKIDKPLTINFGGKKMTSTDGGFDVYANVTLKNGTLESLKWGAWVQGGAKLNVESDMTIITTSTEGNKGGVTVQGQGSTVTVKGKITSAGGITVSGIGNKADGGVTINIEDGAVITNTNPEGLGVFFPNTEQLNIRGGTITGMTGVWVKSGNVAITGGTIIGTGTKREYEYKTEGGAGYPTGEALVIEKCRYPGGDPAVNITGGTFIAENADTAVGSYIGNGDTAPLEKFVNGGNYSSSLKDTPFLSDTLRAELKKTSGDAPFSYYPTYEAAKAEADANGGTVTDLRAISAVSASVTAPTKGTALATNVTLPADAKYTAAVQWFDEADPTTAVTGNAKGGKRYKAKITLTANAGESFAESLKDAEVDGYTVSYVNQTTLELTQTFKATEAAVLTGLEVTGYTGGTKSAGETISADELTVKATYDDGTEDASYQDYEIAYANGTRLSRGDTMFTVKKDNVTATYTFQNAVTGKTVTAELFALTDPNLTFNGNDQIETIRNAVSVKAEFAGKIGNITVTVKQADADVTDATNAGSYDVWVTCEAGSEYDALATPIRVGSVTIAQKALTAADFTKGTNPVYNGTEQSAPVTTTLPDAGYEVTGTAKLTNVSATDVTVTYTGKGNYTGSIDVTWNLEKATPTAADFTLPTLTEKSYTGSKISVDAPTTSKTGMGTVTVKYDGTEEAPTYAGTYALIFDVAEGNNYKAATGLTVGNLVIKAADQTPAITKTATLTTGGKTLDLAALVQNAKGTVSFEIASGDAATLNGSTLTSDADKTGEVKITVKITAKDENNDGNPEYNEYTGTEAITVTVSEQQKETVVVAANDITAIYDGNAVPAEKITGTATVNGVAVTGSWEWKAGQNLINVADSGKKTVVFKPTDSTAYAEAETELTLTIQRAKVTGTPSWVEISESGKTLADAKLGMGTLQPAGGILAWTLPGNTIVQANISYEWTYTPADAKNYETMTGSVTLLRRSSGSSTVTPGALITISRPQHGSVTSSAGSSAIPGSNVMLTVTPDRGYELGSLSVRDSRGSELLLTNLGGGKYSFTMPAGSVQVDASFRKVTSASFVDVLPGSYYYDAVRWAVSNGITSGTSGITFSPNAACTRAQVVTFLWRAAGSPKPASNVNSFADVPADAYYRDAVLWAVEQGITNGVSEGRFDPNATVTRGQTVAFLYRAAGRPSVSGSSVFHDVDAGAYYEDAVTWAYQKDITGGTSSSQFSPDAACTRAQIVTFLYRAQ